MTYRNSAIVVGVITVDVSVTGRPRRNASANFLQRSRSVKDQFAGGIAERMVGLFHPDLRMFGAVIHDYVD